MVYHRWLMRHSVGLVAAVLLAVIGAGAAAQTGGAKAPRRPHLAGDQDTNSATAYYAYGLSALEMEPEAAASAFYWASRLDPTWAAPVYGQYAALLVTQPPRMLTGYITRERFAERDPTLRRADSLADVALLKNPFVERRFDGVVLSTWVSRIPNGEEELREYTFRSRRLAAWVAFSRGDFKLAVTDYAAAIKQYPEELELRLWLARAYFAMGLNDSALVAVQSSLGLQRNKEADQGWGWISHAFTEYSIGFLFEVAEQRDSARAAYERALLEDVTFHPAHYRLAKARLAARDTAGALAEFIQAATLAPGDAGYLYDLGMLLLGMGRADSGATVLMQATAAEPYYALPHLPLGLVYERSGFAKEAAEQYATFLRLAPRSMAPAIAAARQHLATLETVAPGP
jgi:tetratricopeptide (TPR) repeat protein